MLRERKALIVKQLHAQVRLAVGFSGILSPLIFFGSFKDRDAEVFYAFEEDMANLDVVCGHRLWRFIFLLLQFLTHHF